MHTDDGGLPPGDLYPAGFSLAPHPSFAPYDALPVVSAWRVRRPGLLGLCVTEVAAPFRVITSDPSPADPRQGLWIRVQGEDGEAEPTNFSGRPMLVRSKHARL